jgi:hypothetical protein
MLGLMLLTLLLQGPRDVQLDKVAPKPLVKVPKGTVIPVELLNQLSTRTIKEGDSISARTIFPISIDNKIVIPVGTNVYGRIKAAERAGKVKGKASLTLSFETIILPNGVKLPIYASLGSADEGNRDGENTVKGDSSTGKDAGTVAKAGAGGAVGGAIINGGKGAGVGAGIGAGVGLANVLLTRGPDLTLPKGTELEIVLDEELEI